MQRQTLDFRTGNETVDEVARLDLYGKTIPDRWYGELRRENGQADLAGITLLADIVSCYSPRPIYDEAGRLVGYAPKFRGKVLCKTYDEFAEQYGLSKQTVLNAMKRLEKLGVINRMFVTLLYEKSTGTGKIPNVLHVRLNVEKLREITE